MRWSIGCLVVLVLGCDADNEDARFGTGPGVWHPTNEVVYLGEGILNDRSSVMIGETTVPSLRQIGAEPGCPVTVEATETVKISGVIYLHEKFVALVREHAERIPRENGNGKVPQVFLHFGFAAEDYFETGGATPSGLNDSAARIQLRLSEDGGVRFEDIELGSIGAPNVPHNLRISFEHPKPKEESMSLEQEFSPVFQSKVCFKTK